MDAIRRIIRESLDKKIYYHGVGPDGKFSTFSKDYIGSTSGNYGHFGKGFYFTDTYSKAKAFSEFYGGTGEVIAAMLDMKNPFYVNEKNLATIGEKYKLNLPRKINVAIDLKDLLKQLKEKDQIAYQLLYLISKNNDQSLGWEKFIENNPRQFEGSTGIDLNWISDWYEETQKGRYDRGVSSHTEKEMASIGITPKYIQDYEEDLRMDYLTNLGQDSEPWTDAIQQDGHDSIIAGDEIVVFEPHQIHIID